jgi:hypothetical protein
MEARQPYKSVPDSVIVLKYICETTDLKTGKLKRGERIGTGAFIFLDLFTGAEISYSSKCGAMVILTVIQMMN